MNIETFLSRLDKVKSLGSGMFVACCPVHNEKTPSLSIRELEGERIIMHCFGCGANGVDVCKALDIDLAELFPPTNKTYKREKQPFSAEMILEALSHEATVLECAAYDIVQKIPISKENYQRLMLARARIVKAVEIMKS